MRSRQTSALAFPAAAALFAVITLAFVLTGCSGRFTMHGGRHHHDPGSDTRGEQAVAAGDALTIEIADYAFRPGNVVVAQGTNVTWVNRDGVPHTATATGGAFDTGLLQGGESATLRLDEPGVYEYTCLPHPSMKARIEVVPGA